MNSADPNEEEIQIEKAKTNPQDFGELYDRYLDRIYGFIYRHTGDSMLAQDITAATFEKALRGLKHYKPSGFGFGAWLYRIARNEIAQHYRRARWFAPFLREQARHSDDESNVLRQIEQNQQNAALLQALSKLRSDDRTLLLLRFYENLPSEEVAQILGYSLPNLYVHLHRALKRLRKYFDQADEAGLTLESHPNEPSRKESLHA